MKPPRSARRLMALLTPGEDRDFLLPDLEERWTRIAEARGRRSADLWYWRQLLRVPPSLALAAVRDFARGGPGRWVAEVGQGVRCLRRRPLYALGFAGTIGLGIGSAALVGAVAWHTWLAPLPWPGSDQLVHIAEIEDEGSGSPAFVSPPLLEDLRSSDLTTLEAVAGITADSPHWITPEGASQLAAHRVSDDFFALLRARPVAGRLSFRRDAHEAVASTAFVRARLASTPEQAIGTRLDLDGTAFTIVGVVDLDGGYPTSADLVLPIRFEPEGLTSAWRGARYLAVVGRLADGATAVDATGELTAFVRELAETEPQHAGWSMVVDGLSDHLVRDFRDALRLLGATGVAFLLLAGVNVAGLVAARGLERREEVAVRRALGASSGALVRASGAEAVALGGVGIVVVLALAWSALPQIVGLLPVELPRRESIHLSGWNLIVFAGAGALVALFAGIAGHLLSNRRSTRPGTRSATEGLAGRHALVVVQIAVTTLLLASGALMGGRFLELRATDLGFRADDLVAAPFVLPEGSYPDPELRWDYWRRLTDELEAIGVAATVTNNAPMGGSTMNFGFTVDGVDGQRFGQYHAITAGYFRVLGIPVLQGRDFEAGEEAPGVIVNERFVELLAGEEPVLGRTVVLNGTARRIVGVVGDTHHFGPDREPPIELYVPTRQDAWSFSHVLARAGSDRIRAIEEAVSRVDPGLDAPSFTPWSWKVREWFAPLRIQMAVVAALGVIGTLLAALGLYTVLACHVRARVREIGIRVALGASAGGIFRRALLHSAALAVTGAVIGMSAWAAVQTRIGALLGMEGGGSPAAAVAVVAAVLAVSLLAGLLPAVRSSRVDPLVSLRSG